MEIYGLSGKAGTGKSYQAGELAARLKIRGLVDDGLFMYDGNIVAGVSAKKQATGIAAIRTALFTDDKHCWSVEKAIEQLDPEKILIIGTSDKMVIKIAARLGLPTPSRLIHIEDITTEEQREKARQSRYEEGMHIIPAPTFQLKRQFSGYFLDPRKSFGRDTAIEKTIVRPSYSYLGDYIMSDKVISDIVAHIGSFVPGIADILWTSFDNGEDGCVVRTVVQMKADAHFRSSAEIMQKALFEAVANMTAFNVLGVEVEIRGFK